MKRVNTQYYLDITDQICPMTFVRTKLLIEKMANGERATVRLQGAEPLQNVPRSVRDHGHKVISITLADDNDPYGAHLLVLEIADI